MIGCSAGSGAFDARFQQAAPQRTQARNRIGATDIDAEFGALDFWQGNFRRVRLGALVRRRGRDHRRIGSAVMAFAAWTARSVFRRPDPAAPSWIWIRPAASARQFGGRAVMRAAFLRVAEAFRRGAGLRHWQRRRRIFSGGARRAARRDRRDRGSLRRGAGAWLAGCASDGEPARSRCLPGDRAGDGIQPLFQHGDARIEPVAIAVQRIDGGGEPARLVLAFPRHGSAAGWPAAPGRRSPSGRAASRARPGWP